MAGPEHKDSIDKGDEMLRQLQELAEQTRKPETQKALASQMPDRVKNRAQTNREQSHGTPGMISHGPHLTPEERMNNSAKNVRESQISSAEGAANSAEAKNRKIEGIKTALAGLDAISPRGNALQNLKMNLANASLFDLQ